MAMVLQRVIVTLMIFSMMPLSVHADDQLKPVASNAVSQKRVIPKNVELDAEGNLKFAFVDSTGRTLADATAIVIADQKPQKHRDVASGKFVVPVAKPGVVVIIAGDYTYGCRVWKHGTAPPKSLKSIAFVIKQDAVAEVRGQGFGSALKSTQKLYGLAILALGGVALWQALDRDDDAS
ncbi:MAG: hypothetical protein ABJZ55_23010 [Fuerstiella sp.]